MIFLKQRYLLKTLLSLFGSLRRVQNFECCCQAEELWCHNIVVALDFFCLASLKQAQGRTNRKQAMAAPGQGELYFRFSKGKLE